MQEYIKDPILIGSLFGLLISSILYPFASGRVWYIDADNDPVSLKSVTGYVWLCCLAVLTFRIFG